MSTNTVIMIVVAVVVVLLVILGLSFVARSARDKKRRAEADRIRDEAREDAARVEKREAIAAETEATVAGFLDPLTTQLLLDFG